VSVLNGGDAVFVVLRTAFAVATKGLEAVLATMGVTASVLAGAICINAFVAYAAIRFFKGETWPLYILWPVAIFSVLNLQESSIVGAYTIWVLWRTRPVETSS